jgi:hypothetical protein
MKVRVPVIVKDPEVTAYKEVAPTEAIEIDEEFFLDGPINGRVAVLDFDEATGDLMPGTRFVAPARDRVVGRYDVPDAPVDLKSRDITRVSVFGSIFKTIQMYEEPDALGRPIRWAFDGPQLLVVPRAGDWRNAYYQRESRSLQFFFFTPNPGQLILTSHSQDIVTHETAHAILDGIAPDLYDATLPQSLAIHEAVADLTAVLAAFRSRDLANRVLAQNGGSIRKSNAFNGIAEQFGEALGRSSLRDLLNEKTLADVDASEPHALSEVLSGALYKSVVFLHDDLTREYSSTGQPDPKLMSHAEVRQMARQEPEVARAYDEAPTGGVPPAVAPPKAPLPPQAAAEKALWIAAQRFKRTLFRGLDYLPPGEVSFADFGRAILAADAASHPESDQQREWIRDEFVRRGISAVPGDLVVPTNYEEPAVAGLDLDAVVDSDWLAYDFANRNRGLLGIPAELPFVVLPRLAVVKKYYHQEGETTVKECLFKVSWTRVEPNRAGNGLPPTRRVAVGTTLAIDWASKRIRARLTTLTGAQEAGQRDVFLKRLVEEDLLAADDTTVTVGGRLPVGRPRGETAGGVLRVRGTACMLHMVEEAVS